MFFELEAALPQIQIMGKICCDEEAEKGTYSLIISELCLIVAYRHVFMCGGEAMGVSCIYVPLFHIMLVCILLSFKCEHFAFLFVLYVLWYCNAYKLCVYLYIICIYDIVLLHAYMHTISTIYSFKLVYYEIHMPEVCLVLVLSILCVWS